MNKCKHLEEIVLHKTVCRTKSNVYQCTASSIEEQNACTFCYKWCVGDEGCASRIRIGRKDGIDIYGCRGIKARKSAIN